MQIKKRKRISYWHYVIAMLLLTVLAWFYIELSATEISNQKMTIAESLTEPIKNNFNTVVADSISDRKIISETDLAKTPAYPKKDKTVVTRVQKQIEPPVLKTTINPEPEIYLLNPATTSASLETEVATNSGNLE